MKFDISGKFVLTAGLWLCGLAVFGQVEDAIPSLGGLTKVDYDAGIVLARIGTGEEFDFSAPEDAVVCADWESFGAARDWFTTDFGDGDGWSFKMGRSLVDSFTIFSHGTVRPSITNAATFVSPLDANIGIVPKSNHELLDESNRPSRFWYCLTDEDTLVLTWQNVLLDRDIDRPVSFQAEIERSGTVTFRYDLSRLGEEVVSGVRVGVMNDGLGRVFTRLPRETTSLRWAYLDPSLGVSNDHDRDGISTRDEIFTHFTDPYSVDTDGDGLNDYCEIRESGSDPRNAHSLNQNYNDYYAYLLDGLDPYSKPNGDGFTALENIFYTGSPKGKTKLPQSDASHAVLEVSAQGVGCGDLRIGDVEVPALVGVEALKVSVPRGIRLPWSVVKGSDDWLFNSEDYCIGGETVGWLEFPLVEATHPCLHTLDSNVKTVSLNPGSDVENLTCTWSCQGDSVTIENLPPLSARITTHFKRSSSVWITYTLSHPQYLFGKTTYRQRCRYCPMIRDDEEGDGYSSDMIYILDLFGFDWCDEHDCELTECWTHRRKHTSAKGAYASAVSNCEETVVGYMKATNSVDQLEDVLKIRRSSKELTQYDYRVYDVTVPDEKYQCCECVEHWSSYAAVRFKSHRLGVYLDGEPFVRTTESCRLNVVGTIPSADYKDAQLVVNVNNTTAIDVRYTVLGVSIIAEGRDLARLNEMNRGFGLPVMLQTDIAKAETLKLCTDVALPNGSVHLAFEDASCRLQLWMRDEEGQYFMVLDSEERPSLDMSLAQWRAMGRYSTDKYATEVKLLALPKSDGDSHGSARLFLGYAGSYDGKYVHDEASQVITVVRPPLLPDYNRDGSIDDKDELLYISGKRLYFWANEDTWSGDDAFEPYTHGFHKDPMLLPTNGCDNIVNGRNDLVNLCPFAVDVHNFTGFWGYYDLYCEVSGSDAGNIHFIPVSMPWTSVGKIVSEDQKTVGGKYLHEAKLEIAKLNAEGDALTYTLQNSLMRLGSSSNGVLALEFVKPNESQWLRVTIRRGKDGEVLFTQTLGASILDVHDMYRWINLDYVCEPQKKDADKTDEDWARERKYATRTDVSWPDSEHADANVFFAHGFNVHVDEAWDWSQAMFKRLWWSGMDAGFTAIRWYGNHSQLWIPKVWPFTDSNGYGSRNYHQNVCNAFLTAGALSEVANKLPGSRKYYIAHSLGNMLICAARQFHGLEYDKYMMLNAAVALEALDPSAISHENGKSKMTPASWRSYPDRVKSAHWYELFSASDPRSRLTWKGLFRDVDNIVNFYSEKDEVVSDGDGKWKNPLSRNWAWYNQERAKGSFLVDWNWEAGWAFNGNYDVIETGGLWGTTTYARHRTATEANSISSDQLISQPFFGAFTHHEILGENGGDYLTNNPEYRWRILSHGIPAESFTVGANSVSRECLDSPSEFKGQGSGDDAVDNAVDNIEMSTRCVKEGCEDDNWVHSYFIQWSMKHTSILYDKIADYIPTTRTK